MDKGVAMKLEERLVSDLQFKALPVKEGIKIQNSFDFRVEYSDDRSRCVARLIQTEAAEDTSQFFLRVEMRGFFRCEGVQTDDDRRLAHVCAYRWLFPHMQAFIRELTTASGMPPLMVDQAQMDVSKVNLEG